MNSMRLFQSFQRDLIFFFFFPLCFMSGASANSDSKKEVSGMVAAYFDSSLLLQKLSKIEDEIKVSTGVRNYAPETGKIIQELEAAIQDMKTRAANGIRNFENPQKVTFEYSVVYGKLNFMRLTTARLNLALRSMATEENILRALSDFERMRASMANQLGPNP